MNAARPNPQQTDLARFSGAYRDPGHLTALLAEASSCYHLVSPATAVGALPEGCSVAVSTVFVDVDNEAYSVTGSGSNDDGDDSGKSKGNGKLGLGKTALDRIAAAAGVSWDPKMSRRLDDGSEPDYCMFVAVGSYRHFDGREVVIQGTKEMDLREGSPQVEALRQRYADKVARWERDGKRGWPPKNPEAQIREMRLHLVGHAETKARLRAVRALGIRSYTRQELAKPFVVVRMVWTGQTDDPQLRRTFATMTAAAMLGGTRALYGASAAPPVAHEPALLTPPPVDTVRDEEDEEPHRAKPLPICCDYCGTEENVAARTTPSGVIKHCSAPKCLELALSDATRAPSESPAAGTTATSHAASSGGSTAPRAAGASYPQGRPSPAGSHGAPGASMPVRTAPPGRADASAPGAPKGPSGFTVPGHGRDGGRPLEQAEDRTLRQWVQTLARNLTSGKTPPKFVDNDQRLLAAMKAELARRAAADAEQPLEGDEGGCGEGDDTIPY